MLKAVESKVRLTVILTHPHVGRNRLAVRKLIISIRKLELTVPVISAGKWHWGLLLSRALHHQRIA